MKAPMLGRTMLDRNVPNLWTWTRAPARSARSTGADVLVAIVPPMRALRERGHMMLTAVNLTNGHVAKRSGSISCPILWFCRGGLDSVLSRLRRASHRLHPPLPTHREDH
ncbi:hypothetical protein GCM10009737_12770 [Nocardioides lentus]|uniref:Uncharacterized protein n=1 Tax=Nocardioides lentus TaxID=338077 RepID=A0ABN2P7S1_9ACTN